LDLGSSSSLLSDSDYLMRALTLHETSNARCYALVEMDLESLSSCLARPKSIKLLNWLNSLFYCSSASWRSAAPRIENNFQLKHLKLKNTFLELNPQEIFYYPSRVASESRPFELCILTDKSLCSALLVSWDHAFLDARGAELLIHLLLSEQSSVTLFYGAESRSGKNLVRSTNVNRLGLIELLKASLRFGRYKIEHKSTRSANAAYFSHDFSRESVQLSLKDSERVRSNLERYNLNLFSSSYFIAASSLALLKLSTHRESLVIGVPHDARMKSRIPYVFPTQLLIVFFKLNREQLTSVVAGSESILRQFTDFVSNSRQRDFAAFMRACRLLPLTLYSKLLHSNGTCDLYVSYLGESFLSDLVKHSQIESFKHYPPHFSKPGLSVVYYWSAGRLNISVVSAIGSAASIPGLPEPKSLLSVITELLLSKSAEGLE
jgi:hypothetical protein